MIRKYSYPTLSKLRELHGRCSGQGSLWSAAWSVRPGVRAALHSARPGSSSFTHSFLCFLRQRSDCLRSIITSDLQYHRALSAQLDRFVVLSWGALGHTMT